MDFKFDLKKLEKVFSNNFESLSYSVLAHEYIKKNDLNRALTVLEIGQENNPEDLAGKYLLAKVHLLKGEVLKAKQSLNQILNIFPLHLKARLLIIEILKKENNKKELSDNIELLQKHFPNHGAPKQSVVKKSETNNEDRESKDADISKKAKKDPQFSINENMATFTLVNILTTQKNFTEALVVLDMLEKKGKDINKIKEKRSAINEKIKG